MEVVLVLLYFWFCRKYRQI